MLHLTDAITVLKGVGTQRARELAGQGIYTVGDLLEYYPYRYEDRSQLKTVSQLQEGEMETVMGRIAQVREISPRRGLRILRVLVNCDGGMAELVWFNQNHLKGKLLPGLHLIAHGRVGRGAIRQLAVADYELLQEEADRHMFQRIVPVYHGTEKLNSKQLRNLVRQVLEQQVEGLEEYLPGHLLSCANLMPYPQAVQQMHFPDSMEQQQKARHRLAFNEFLELMLGLKLHRIIESRAGIAHSRQEGLAQRFFAHLPFALTEAQQRVVGEIRQDMEQPQAMKRLVQGDVGSGKTVVAVYTLLKAVESGYQGVLMAPTEILAEQHYLNLKKMLAPLQIEPVLLTGTLSRRERETVYGQIASGEAAVIVGTHALIQKQVQYHNVGVVVIDEQHRFGVRQRLALENKGLAPDVLVMTATPIPRSLALTLYGDMQLSVIDQLPPGRQPVKTYCMGEKRRQDLYGFLDRQLQQGYQSYIVCPLVEESEKLDLENATQLADHLAVNVFPQYTVGLLHGRMKAAEKEEIMEQFRQGQLQILVSTTVIEVGVDVPNANVMVIENAERFGLAQLHQLRGRVGRGSSQAYCFLIAEPKSNEGKRRMTVMVQHSDGFILAEEDLAIRGAGEVLGTRQHGLPDFKAANLVADGRILELSQRMAARILQEGLEQPAYAGLRQRAEQIYQRRMQLETKP